jgi:hypothetical protein
LRGCCLNHRLVSDSRVLGINVQEGTSCFDDGQHSHNRPDRLLEAEDNDRLRLDTELILQSSR